MNWESSSQAGGPRVASASDQAAVDSNESAAAVDVVLAAPDAMVRSELCAWLKQHGGFVVAAEKINATQALGATLFHSPRVCLLAIDLPGDLEGRIKSIRAERPDTRIGILARSADQPGLLHAVLAGADGVLLTSDPPETFVAELGALARGGRVLPTDEGQAPTPEGAEAPGAAAPAAEIGDEDTAVPSDKPELVSRAEAPAFAVGQSRDGWLKATVLYVPRFFRHLRRRLRARMPLPIAWSSARERMWDYR